MLNDTTSTNAVWSSLTLGIAHAGCLLCCAVQTQEEMQEVEHYK
jgi:hypothetical protein